MSFSILKMDTGIDSNSYHTQNSEKMELIDIQVNRFYKDQLYNICMQIRNGRNNELYRLCTISIEKTSDVRSCLDDYSRNILFLKRTIYIPSEMR